MDPSSFGWIEKFFAEQKITKVNLASNELDFYTKTRATGFIFGHIISFDVPVSISLNNKLPEEISKIGLLNTLFGMYGLIKQDVSPDNFLSEVIHFYNIIASKSDNPLEKLLSNNSKSSKLEKIIQERVQTNDDFFSKQFSHVITNAILFIDILAFKKYLEKGVQIEEYFNKLEQSVMEIVTLALKSKICTPENDELITTLFESSFRNTKFSKNNTTTVENIDLGYLKNDLEKYYLIDIASISLKSDEKIENDAHYFLIKLAQKLDISENFIIESDCFISNYITEYKNEIPYLNTSNSMTTFYNHTTKNVAVLISRNKKRLVKELSESKELVQLIAKSTHKELNKDEKKKVKNQLLDICKTVPSLSIFLLPGGSLLLPILIKFIPQLLPSAFNENKEDQ